MGQDLRSCICPLGLSTHHVPSSPWERAPGKGGLQRILLEVSSQVLVPAHLPAGAQLPQRQSRSLSWLQTPLCSVSLASTPRLADRPADGKE